MKCTQKAEKKLFLEGDLFMDGGKRASVRNIVISVLLIVVGIAMLMRQTRDRKKRGNEHQPANNGTLMKKDIILSGVGGQGILSIATVIGKAALDAGLSIKQAEVHGMSQRGGDVQSNLRIASGEIASDLIARGVADIIISLEPMEALRYLPWLSKEGWVITNTAPLINIPNYPEAEALRRELDALPHVVALDVDAIAKSAASPRAANIVLLGAAAPFLGIDAEKLEAGIRAIFARKGQEIVEMNLAAFRAGYQYAQKQTE